MVEQYEIMEEGALMRVYLDNCCFNRPYDDQSQLRISIETQAKLYIQREITEGKLELVTSYVLLAENSANTVEQKKQNIKKFIDENTHIFISTSNKNAIEDKAKKIMEQGIKFLDACHVASAIYADCDYFISTDKRLLKYHTDEIVLINPTGFVLEMDGGQDE